ncbi:trypsin-1-like [Aedes albopictus]|uniref:trypsin n=1 Tax=Aedes albopictus TaxID=7160 RepID=A0ABM1XXN4_AEDAL
MASTVFAVTFELILLITAGYALPSRAHQRIVGGDEIDIAKVPFMASVSGNRGHYCGGSILSGRWILTAAHCIGDSGSSGLAVRVGSSRHAEGGQQVRVRRCEVHPRWNPSTIDYDFALLELEEVLVLGKDVQAVVLPAKDEAVAYGKVLLVCGWGKTVNGGSANSPTLRAVNVPVVNQKQCERAYSNFVQVTPRMLCAGHAEGGKDMCNEDSGGPLVDGKKQVGVVSWSKECAAAGTPGVYARVAVVRDWIKEVAGV